PRFRRHAAHGVGRKGQGLGGFLSGLLRRGDARQIGRVRGTWREQVVIGDRRRRSGPRLQLQHLALQIGQRSINPRLCSRNGVHGGPFFQIPCRTCRRAGVKRRRPRFILFLRKGLAVTDAPIASVLAAFAKPSPKQMADAIRVLSMDAVEKAKSGHPGMPMGMADVATVLYSKFLKFDASRPDWADRDRFILSAGHGSMLIYSLLHLTGYKDATKEQLENFRQWGFKTAGHPEYGHMAGIETTTGPLGQGLATSVGFALAERHLAARFGKDLVDHRTWVVAGDGCLMEGVSQEAI